MLINARRRVFKEEGCCCCEVFGSRLLPPGLGEDAAAGEEGDWPLLLLPPSIGRGEDIMTRLLKL